MVITKPELYIDEYVDWFRDVTGRVISLATMCRTIIRLGFTYKKVSLLLAQTFKLVVICSKYTLEILHTFDLLKKS